MGIDERRRHQLGIDARRAMGEESGTTLMELLPPVGWADVATKHDLAVLEQRLDLRFAAIDERFKYFKPPLPTSTLIGVARLAMPEMLVEIEAEAVIETNRLRLPKTGVVSR